jgi:hypothetical protein
MFIVLNAIGVPTSDIGLLFAVDWLVDRIRTTNNLLGDLYATVFVEYYSQDELKAMDSHATTSSSIAGESTGINPSDVNIQMPMKATNIITNGKGSLNAISNGFVPTPV